MVTRTSKLLHYVTSCFHQMTLMAFICVVCVSRESLPHSSSARFLQASNILLLWWWRSDPTPAEIGVDSLEHCLYALLSAWAFSFLEVISLGKKCVGFSADNLCARWIISLSKYCYVIILHSDPYSTIIKRMIKGGCLISVIQKNQFKKTF